MPRQKYNTDITQKQWNEIKKLLPPPKRITKRSLDRREIINTVLCLVHIGCQWRNLPHDFPNWKSVYNVWYQWRNDGTWQRIHDQEGAKDVLQGIKKENRRLQVVFADSVYKRIKLPDWVKGEGFLLQPVLRPARGKGFIVLPKRWIVERTHAWVGNSLRHSKDYEHQTKSSETMILIAMTRIVLKYCQNNNL